MPVAPRPRWSKSKSCWLANVGPRGPDGRKSEVYLRLPIGNISPPVGSKDERQAFRWLDAYQAEQRKVATSPNLVTTAAAKPTLQEIAQDYLEWSTAQVIERPKTAPQHANRLVHLSRACAVLGEVVAAELSADHHAELIKRLKGEKLSEHYVRSIHRTLVACLNWAARPMPGRNGRLLDANPLAGIRPPKVRRVRGRYVGNEGIAQLWVWAAGRARYLAADARHFERSFLRYFAFLLATGCRPGEAIRLRWDEVDWRRALAIRDEHKTGERTGTDRVIPLSPRALRTLRRLRDDPRSHPEFVFVCRPSKGAPPTEFERKHGRPWSEANAAAHAMRRLRRRAIEAGCELADEGPARLTGYSARYKSVTDRLADGLPRELVARIHGHSPEMVRDAYEQLEEERLALVLAELEARKRDF